MNSDENNNLTIIGVALGIAGLALMLYGNSQNNNIGSQVSSLLKSGQINPGTPWIILGGAVLCVGIILVIKKLFYDKK